MVKLKEGKLKWALKQKDKKNNDLAFICGVKVRRFQQLKQEFNETGSVPILKKNRRPKTSLTYEEKKKDGLEHMKKTGISLKRSMSLLEGTTTKLI